MASIMIVDDSKFMRNIIRKALESDNHTIINEAENGNDAIEYYKQDKPDIVTMDVTMRGKDGLDTVNEIISMDPKAKILMISALNKDVMTQNNPEIASKASSFITKPFSKEDLIKKVQELL